MYWNTKSNWRPRLGLGRLAGVAAWIIGMSVLPRISAAPLMEESFNYAAGSSLATDSPWAGSAGTALAVTSGSLTLSNLQSIAPAGNKLQAIAGTTGSAYRNFSPTPVTAGAVYCSFLINCSVAPTNSQFALALLGPGATGASPPDDPLDLYLLPSGSGYSFTVRSGGSDPASAGKILALNTTHFVVVKYTLGSIGQGDVYIDPTPGGTEPLNSDASTSSDDDNTGASSLQVILFRATSSYGPEVCYFDTVRVGSTWQDVTPLVAPLTLTGPEDQAVCQGSPATFSVTPSGTPPYFYSWRTNGVPVPGATNSDYQLPTTSAADASNQYDVVVQDSFGATTSRVASLTLSTTAAFIAAQPANQIVTPTSTDAVFTVTAGGDAPISYQWRTNGVAVPGATNDTFDITNPVSADPTVLYDVVVSNPCGAMTSTPPVKLVFPSVFYEAFDAGPGFFSGENLMLTNKGGLILQTWSSQSLSTPITQWSLEGTMQEQPLNDGTGKSVYSINVTPAVSPVYYIFGASVAAPYLAPIPILTVTTDPSGFYILSSSNMGISSNGTLGTPPLQVSITSVPGGGIAFNGTGAVPGSTYFLQAATNLQPPIQWTTLQTNVADSNGVISFSETNAPTPVRYYRLSAQ